MQILLDSYRFSFTFYIKKKDSTTNKLMIVLCCLMILSSILKKFYAKYMPIPGNESSPEFWILGFDSETLNLLVHILAGHK